MFPVFPNLQNDSVLNGFLIWTKTIKTQFHISTTKLIITYRVLKLYKEPFGGGSGEAIPEKVWVEFCTNCTNNTVKCALIIYLWRTWSQCKMLHYDYEKLYDTFISL